MKKVFLGSAILASLIVFSGCSGDKKVEERVAQIQSNETAAVDTNTATLPAVSEKNETAKVDAQPLKAESLPKSDTLKGDEPKAVASSTADGKAIFGARCVACHGQNGEGKGTFPKIAGLSKDNALRILKGYADGSYGKAQKMIMAAQAKGLDDSQKEAVAEYIATLK